jgi:hypothetical protein
MWARERKSSSQGIRGRQVELARAVVGRVDHRVDGVDVLREPAGHLADSKVARGRQSEDVDRHAHTEPIRLARGVVGEARDRPAHRLGGLAREDGGLDRAVAREAHVVELDLVEGRASRRLSDPDDVLPQARVVGVRPTESGVVHPDRAVAVLDREVGARGGQRRVLEDDDAADQVDACGTGLKHRVRGLVVRSRGADFARDRARGHQEPDLAGLVLDVELERGQARDREILVELPGPVRQRTS